METNELQNIWKNVDGEISLKSPDELERLLTTRIRKAINKFLFILSLDIVVSIGLIIFLITTALNRRGDIIYQTNNYLLCLITFGSLIVSFLSWKSLKVNRYNLSVKDWLGYRIKLLSKWLFGKYRKLYIILIPILLIMISTSIHVYYEYKPFTEVMKNEESIFGLTIGFAVGLWVSFFTYKKIRNYEIKNLEYLKELHDNLE